MWCACVSTFLKFFIEHSIESSGQYKHRNLNGWIRDNYMYYRKLVEHYYSYSSINATIYYLTDVCYIAKKIIFLLTKCIIYMLFTNGHENGQIIYFTMSKTTVHAKRGVIMLCKHLVSPLSCAPSSEPALIRSGHENRKVKIELLAVP